ncbi:protein of unknown function [Caballeronia sp. S22]
MAVHIGLRVYVMAVLLNNISIADATLVNIAPSTLMRIESCTGLI